ncbi:hypothetical protein KA025_00875 [Candidatus Saccharibacteria bacterium]|jgi:glycerophosphoryl diester phosphodiesterase|nr:hypothetical protein [Candidatus Saccharibacteria bacterium]MBP7834619.1 hypothetical protein [Candidatus Saccharibacteria bacterium]
MNVISHRGAKGLAPENSLESIIVADKLQPAYIEFDVQTTKDDITVLYHNKYTQSGKQICEYTYPELAKEYPSIIKLAQALDSIKYSTPLVELKYVSNPALVVSEISGNVAFTSFNQKQIINLKKTWQGELFLMQRKHPFGIIRKATNNNLTGVGINKNWLILLPIIYSLCQKNKLKMYIYTLNNIFLASILSKLFPEIYICTDLPDKLLGQ